MGRAPYHGRAAGGSPRAFSTCLRCHLAHQQIWPAVSVLDGEEEHRCDEDEEAAVVDAMVKEEQEEETMYADFEFAVIEDSELVSLLEAAGSDAVRCSILTHCERAAVVSLRATCRELLTGTHDTFGRLLVGCAVLQAGAEASSLQRLSPKLLTHLRMPNVQCEDALAALTASELGTLKHLTIRFATPRLGSTTMADRADRLRSASGMMQALGSGLPTSLTSLDADLRGGYLLVGDVAVEAFSKGIPEGLKNLKLDLSHFTSRGAQAVAAALPRSLDKLRLLFRGRSFIWLGHLGDEDEGLEALSAALPSQLSELHVMLECTDQGAIGLLSSLPPRLTKLDLDLHVMAALRSVPSAPERFPDALAKVLPRHLVAFRLRISDFALSLQSIRVLAGAMPQRLKDLRLDLSGTSLGDEGAKVLAGTLPRGLTRLALCLRGWRFTKIGVRAIAHALPRHIRRLKLVFSGSPIGAAGVRALVMWMPPRLEQLNLSLRLCGIGTEGRHLLNPLAREWSAKAGSWVRACDLICPVSQALVDNSGEWEIWDD